MHRTSVYHILLRARLLEISLSPTGAMRSLSKVSRLQLRSRARDDVLLNRLLSEVRFHEKKVREELRRADETIADLRSEFEQERSYISRLKKERDQARTKFEDAVAEADTSRRDLAEM